MEKSRYTVIIADDEAAICNGLIEAIPWESYGIQVVGKASDGQEALSMVLQLQPDLAVIDIKMPLIDGLEVIRQSGENGCRTRFMILSGYDDFALAQKAIRYGACAYFLKPLRIEEFKEELSKLLGEITCQRNQEKNNPVMDKLVRSSKAFLLNQLISNELRHKEDIEMLVSMGGLDWLTDSYRIAACSASIAEPEKLAEVLERAGASFEEALSGTAHEIWMYGSEMLLLAVSGQDEMFETQRGLLADALAELHHQTGSRLYMGVGKTVSGADQAAFSYTTALRALSYHIYQHTDEIYDNSMVCRQEPPSDVSKISFEPLVMAMEKPEPECVHQFCKQYIQQLFFVEMPPPDFLRGMCIHLVNNARIQFLARHPDFVSVLALNAQEIRLCHCVEDLCAWTEKEILTLAEEYCQKRTEQDPIIVKAKAFIRANISENIKARDVAAAVNLSESYFTVYFKQKTDENFRDYLLSVRMEQARKLLMENKMNISEIAAATGYQDYRSFSRAFKHMTGKSPTEYQNT